MRRIFVILLELRHLNKDPKISCSILFTVLSLSEIKYNAMTHSSGLKYVRVLFRRITNDLEDVKYTCEIKLDLFSPELVSYVKSVLR